MHTGKPNHIHKWKPHTDIFLWNLINLYCPWKPKCEIRCSPNVFDLHQASKLFFTVRKAVKHKFVFWAHACVLVNWIGSLLVWSMQLMQTLDYSKIEHKLKTISFQFAELFGFKFRSCWKNCKLGWCLVFIFTYWSNKDLLDHISWWNNWFGEIHCVAP